MIDWSDSKTGELEMWKNPLIPVEERLQIADGAIAFRDSIIKNLREQLTSAEKDAKRYQWMKENTDWYPAGYNGYPADRFDFLWRNTESNLDVAIDTDMEESSD